jgi:diacylglycerol kinase family enzyme
MPIALGKDEPDPISALLIKRLRRRRVPAVAAKLFLRKDLDELKEAEVWTGVDSLSAVAKPPVAAQADGESLGVVDEAELIWHPDALRVLGPQSSI